MAPPYRARVLALLEMLQSSGTCTAATLAARLEVDERTVRRYITQLLDLDIPVETVRGRTGGYRLASGFRMPPLMLTDDEALAVLLGLTAGRRLGLTPSEPAGNTAADKVRRVLPEATARRLDALLRTIDVTGPADDETTARPAITGADGSVLLLMAQAAHERRPVALSYSGQRGPTARTVWPFGIVAHAGRWFVAGNDSGRGQARMFRLDRIAFPRLLPGSFEVPDGFDPVSFVLDSLADTPWKHQVSVRVEATIADLRPRLPPGLVTLREHGAGWSRLRLRAERLDWVPAVLAGLDRRFVVEGPAELRSLVRSFGQRLQEWATDS